MNQLDGPKNVSIRCENSAQCRLAPPNIQPPRANRYPSENCSTILDKLQEDRLLKVKKRSFRLSGGATVSQTPELASSEGSDGFVCTGGRQNFLKEVTNVLPWKPPKQQGECHGNWEPSLNWN